jgi:CelD/BcsL family acetyltransferase involved in cellulose biosynthesis
MAEIEKIDTPERLDGLREEWGALLAESASDNVFLTWEWLRTWWRHLAAGRRLHLLALRSAGQLVALAPLARSSGLVGRVLPQLGFLGTGIVGSDYLDVIVRRGSERQAADALGDFLADSGAALQLRQLQAASFSEGVLLALAERGWVVARAKSDVCPFIPLAGHDWESFLASLGPEHRYNVRRRLRQLERQGQLRFQRVETDETRRDVLGELVRLHRERWSGRGGSQAFGPPEVTAFHEEWSSLALARGWLRLFALRLDGRLIAALYGFRYGRTFSYYQLGWDAEFQTRSVGLVALALAIRAAIEEAAAEFDLLHGNEAYKSLWARESRDLFRAQAYPPTARGSALRAATAAAASGRRVARRILEATLGEPALGRAGTGEGARAAAAR